jgi:hypothetical protein
MGVLIPDPDGVGLPGSRVRFLLPMLRGASI